MIMKIIKGLNKFFSEVHEDLSEGKYDRSRSKIEDYRTENEILIEEAKNLETRRLNKKIKDEINKDKRFIRSGKTYTFMAFICFLANLGLSIAGGCTITKNMLFIGIYILVMTVLEGSIFISAKTMHDDRKYFAIHYKTLKNFRGILMITSISLNILFFHNLFKDILVDIIMSPLCISLGFLTIRFSSLGYDKKYLNYSKDFEDKNISTLGMFFNNLFYPLRDRIEQTYNNNHNPKVIENCSKDENFSLKVVENDPKVEKLLSKDFEGNSNVVEMFSKDENNDQKLISDIERYIRKTWKKDEIVNTSQIKKEFDLTDHQWKKIKTSISNIYTTANKRTLVK